jgi:hypothetical protein
MNRARTSVLSLSPADDYIADGLPPEKAVSAPAVRAWRQQRETLVHPSPNSHTDAVCVTLVLDVLLRLNPSSRIRSRELTAELNQLYPQILWDTRTVGRILASSFEAAKGSAAPENELPLSSYVSQGLTTYVVNPTLLNWRWLAQVRHNLGVLAEAQVSRERKLGSLQRSADFPWEAFSSAAWGQ